MSFLNLFQKYSWQGMADRIYSKKETDVEIVLSKKSQHNIDDFCTLVSPAATPYLEVMAQQSYDLTRKRFGNTTQLYIPLYLSNECHNICTYCGFSVGNKIKRLTLNHEQIMAEVEVIKSHGFEHVLLVTGEANKSVGVDYLTQVIDWIRPHFSSISIEVQALKQTEYEQLIKHSLNSVMIYQETYHQDNYQNYHPKGKKRNFEYRLETPDRLGKAGIHRIGLGALLGLEDWRVDSSFVALHLDYLQRQYWKTKYSLSLPRLRPAEGIQPPNVDVTDHNFVQLITAYRIYNENVEISLSTRESPRFRDRLLILGITTMSAGSKTDPGGYSMNNQALEQFEIDDKRTPLEVSSMIRSQGFEPIWKDWDTKF